ncbi:translation elongation factor 4 [Chlamydiota bacterium]
MSTKNIRNFCIIAHIDHGKSTLADRLIQYTHTLSKRELKEQVLDDMDIERERGITIKSHPIRMVYKANDGNEYILNLIDTPGHVDFSYEVSRSLSACEGAILLVDASQGVEAQTMANIYLAMEHHLEIIMVINKIDMFNADIEKTSFQLLKIMGGKKEDILLTSGKTGEGCGEVLENVIKNVPSPKNNAQEALRALIFDSFYDSYKGVIVYVRIFDGIIRPGMKIKLMNNNKEFEVSEVGAFKMNLIPKDNLSSGEVGYFIANIRSASDVLIGDTVTEEKHPASQSLKGFKRLKPMVFCGLYPVSTEDFPLLKGSLEKLWLNDPSFTYQPEECMALGYGFRCGFLGLLHMEIVQERLEREYNIELVTTTPNVVYKIVMMDGKEEEIDNPIKMPPNTEIQAIKEPFIEACIIIPNEYIGAVLQLGQDSRGNCIGTESLDDERVIMTFDLPLNEIITGFYDKLKSITRGFGSMDYEIKDSRKSDMVKVNILINNEPVDAFCFMFHKSKAESRGRQIVKKLKEIIPQQWFQIAIQAAIDNKIIARETIKALKKDVTAKCYGGDITRKRKLWAKQKEGKKKMKQVGKINIPQKAFIEVLKVD